LLKHPTLDQLHTLGLHGMAKAFVEVAASDEAGGLTGVWNRSTPPRATIF
jgi:hypothetical protein